MRRWIVGAATVVCSACGTSSGPSAEGGSGSETGQADDSTTSVTSGPGTTSDGGTTTGVTATGADSGGGTGGTATGGAGDGPLLVVSLNLLHGFPDFAQLDQRTQIVIDWVDDNQPDVLALQEVGQTALIQNRAEALSDATGYQWVWERASGVPGIFEEGSGILSRWPITWSESIELPHPGGGGFERRRTIGAHITTPHGPVAVFSAHLTTQDDEVIAADQAAVSHDFVLQNRTALPGIFAGDMNEEPDRLAMRFLRGEAMHQGMAGQFVDAWLAVNPGLPGLTAPADAPQRRIDYVYAVPGTAGTAVVDRCELILDTPVSNLLASDHIGVACWVVVAP